MGKGIFFISNSSGKTREDYLAKIQKMGYSECRIDQIYGSAYIAAQYLKEKCPEITKVRVVGMNSIRKELKEVGIDSVGGQDLEGYDTGKMEFNEFEKAEIDP